jgi:F0F1-type ATP synthase assembly protein I
MSRLEDRGISARSANDSMAFFGSIMAGFLLGALADRLLGTYPVLVVIGIIAGSIVGFWRMWTIANRDQ